METARYKLHPAQYAVYRDQTRFIVLAAGRRFGKTVLAIVRLLISATAKNGAKCWYIAPTYRQAEMIAWKMLFDMIPKRLIKSKNEVRLELTLVNGSEISLKGADNEDSLRGVGLDDCILDEYASMKPNVWEEIIRPMLADRKGRAFFIGTPKGKNHFWELWLKGEQKKDNYSSYQFKTEDNPLIARSEIKEAKEQTNDRFFRQEYEASFEDFTGLIWPEFDEKIHVIDSLEIPSHWNSFGVIDTAITGTTAALKFVVDEHSKIYVVKEYYERDKRVNEVVNVLRDWNIKNWYIDPAAKLQKTASLGKVYSLYDEYMESGIMATPAENDVDAGINRVAEYLKTGKISVLRTCSNLLFEIARYHWSEERETVLGISRPQPYKSLDHLCDCLRYGIMSRPRPSVKAEEMREGTKEWWDFMEKSQRRNRIATGQEYEEELVEENS